MTAMPDSPVPNSLKVLAFGDIERDVAVTRRVLERLPEEKFAWKPHEKSRSLGGLAMHVANLAHWMLDTLQRDALDMQNPPPLRNDPKNLADILETFDQHANKVNA